MRRRVGRNELSSGWVGDGVLGENERERFK